jgi:hypothetical protein
MAAEAKFQAKLKRQYEKGGWFVLRLITATGTGMKSGIPDLVVMKPHGTEPGVMNVKFIEVKAKTGRISPLQEYAMGELEKFGFEVELAREEK